MKGIHISGDNEAAGPQPYSMISTGSCVIGMPHFNFYRELKRLTLQYDLEALKVGALHLECLPKEAKYDPKSDAFDGLATMKALMDLGEDPHRAMSDYRDWIHTVRGPHQPIYTTDVQPFDGGFTFAYLNEFAGENPYGHKGRNIDELLRGAMRDVDAKLSDMSKRLGIKDDRARPHHALDDAIFQSYLAIPILDMIWDDWRSTLSHLK